LLQTSIDPPIILIVGDAPPTIGTLIDRYFPGRHFSAPDVFGAVKAIRTPLVGYLGSEVILHDPRTVQVLSSLLDDQAIATASCVLVITEKSGKSWRSSVIDAGIVSVPDGSPRPRAEQSRKASELWRSVLPTALPPRDLWLARASSVAVWLERGGPLGASEGIHACTTMISASVRSTRTEDAPHLAPPIAAAENIMRVEELFG